MTLSKLLKNVITPLTLIASLLILFVVTPLTKTNAQFGGEFGAISATAKWGTESFRASYSVRNNSTGSTINTEGNTGFVLSPGEYTVSAFSWPNGGPNVFIGSQTVNVTAGQTTMVSFDAQSVSGLVKGSIKVNGQGAQSQIQFCTPGGPCGFSASDGPIYFIDAIDASSFNIPLAPGDYIAHAKLSETNKDLGTIPVTIVAGQINSSVQFSITNYGAISANAKWGTESFRASFSVRNDSTGATFSTEGNTGFTLTPGSYTVSAFSWPNGGPGVFIGSKTVNVSGGQTTTVSFDAQPVSGLVKGSIKVNGQGAQSQIQFCTPGGPCGFSASDGPLYFIDAVDASSFNIPLAPGNYIAHAKLTSNPNIDLGSVPITVVAGEILSDSSVQFGFSYGAVSATATWGTEAIRTGFSVRNNSTGFTTSTEGNTGFILTPGTYTVNAFTRPNGGASAFIGSKTVTVSDGQTTSVSFDAKEVTGLFKGSIKVNGQGAAGQIQFCAPGGPCGFSASDGPLYFIDAVDASNINIALAPGEYIAHAKLSETNKDLGSIAITITAGQIANYAFGNAPPTVDAGGPYNVNEGESINVSATGNDPENGALTYAWDLDNNGTFETTGQNISFSAAGLDGPNTKTIAVRVTDAGGLTATDTATINVANVAPILGTLVVPTDSVETNVDVNTSVTFTDAGTLDTHTTVWNWGDGNTSSGLVNEENGSGTVLGTHQYTNSGTYTIKVTVTDSNGDTAEKTALVTIVVNQPPHVNPISGASINAGGTYTENGSFTDSDSTSWTATVDYGEGIGPETLTLNGNNFALNHQYNVAGTYTVTVVVKDDKQNTGTTTATVTVNAPPQISGLSDTEINYQDDFIETGSFTDIDSTSWTATVDYGDGFGVQPLSLNADKTFTLNRTYPAAGTYTAIVTVTDNQGAIGTANITVKVNAPPYISQLLGATINEGQTYTENGSFSDIDSISWTGVVNYGDGSAPEALSLNPDNTFSLNHLYKDDGTYTVIVTLTDNQGAIGTRTATVTVNNVSPSVSAITASIDPVEVNTPTVASATFTDVGVLDIHTAVWNWGDGTTSNATINAGSISDSHTYTTAGVYPISLTVTDNNGGVTTMTYPYLSVYNPTPQGLFSAGQRFTSPNGGNVIFGLSYKYQGTVPTGTRQFSMDYNQANLHFNATSVSSLVINNGMGTLTGTGTINGTGTYNFLVTGSEAANTVRIKITDQSGNVIYDTQPGDPDNATPTTAVTGNVLAH